ncbi:MAG: serine hydrolase [Deltaproteobacteria bacterium]|nr:serine hydrolase [Deltaproteobacteria bacterium]
MKAFSSKRIVAGIIIILLAVAAYTGYAKREYIEQLPIGCAFKAKTLCAAVFVSGRESAVVEREDVGFNSLFKLFKAKIDRNEKSVTCSLFGIGLFEKKAIHVDKLDAVLLSGVPEASIRRWRPAMPDPEPVDYERTLWPTGDLMPNDPPTGNIDTVKLNQVLENLFAESNPKKKLYTRALIVVHDGRLVAERYGKGITKDTPLLSWSMAKSITNALVGILVREGKLSIRESVPVPEWRQRDDPRREITTDQLLRMSSGLEWFEAYAERPVSDVNVMLFLKPDMGAYTASKPLAVQPDTRWSYSSGTTNLICRMIRDTLGSDEEYWAFPRRELFNRIGMRSAVFGTDASGTFIGSSYLYATARDYARFGLLFLNDGLWLGERILPEGWVAYSTTPTPSAPKGQYGAHFWLNRGENPDPATRKYPKLPSDAFFAMGYQGQTIAIIPSQKLVIVRLGMTYDDDWGMEPFLQSVLAAIK